MAKAYAKANPKDNNAFVFAVVRGELEVVKTMLAGGADPNARDTVGSEAMEGLWLDNTGWQYREGR